MEWLDTHQDESAETYSEKQTDVETIIKPIITKMYQEAGGAQMPNELKCLKALINQNHHLHLLLKK